MGGVYLCIMTKTKSITLMLCGLLAGSSAFAISTEEQADILFMKQEEKMARDVYNALYQQHEIQVFANIARSEQRHMDSVDYLIQTYGLEDPTPAAAGVYTYDALNSMYAELTEKGFQSVVDALEVGVTIETVDIADLESSLLVIEDVTVKNVFGNLLRASKNHLNAFQNNLAFGTEAGSQNPSIGFAQNSQGGVCVVTGETAQGSQSQIQAKPQNGKGAWRGERGNAQGTVAGITNAAVQCQNLDVNCDPNNPTLYRVRVGSGDQVRYSNAVSTHMVDTPWPDAEFLGQGWFATWMGDMHMGQYPLVYNERFGWITIESHGNGEVYWVDSEGDKFMTTEERYPAYFDITQGKWI